MASDRILADFISGTTDAALTEISDTLSGAFLSDIPVVSAPQIMALTLDPEKRGGDPEIVHVTDHSEGATTATILRGREGSQPRAHLSGIKVVASATASGLADLSQFWAPINGFVEDTGAEILGSSFSTYLQVDIVIPTYWNSWRYVALASGLAGDFGVPEVRVQRSGGGDGTVHRLPNWSTGEHASFAVQRGESALSATGSMSFTLQAREADGHSGGAVLSNRQLSVTAYRLT